MSDKLGCYLNFVADGPSATESFHIHLEADAQHLALDFALSHGHLRHWMLSTDLPVLTFPKLSDWEGWLDRNGSESSGAWLRIAKRGAPMSTLSYQEAVEGALCFGWIDGQKKPLDEHCWLQRFTPRGPRSIWSNVNRTRAASLIAVGRMRKAGLAAIQAAKDDGRWERAYDSQARARVPADLASMLKSNPKARAFFETLDSRNRYAILFRLQNAVKPQTRERRLSTFVSMLERHETIYPPSGKRQQGGGPAKRRATS